MKIESKMTAVEWLMEEMQKTYIFNQDDFDMFKQAKEMEKQQITEAFDSDYDYWFTADNYYELKFKK
jgi:hypothetical protein